MLIVKVAFLFVFLTWFPGYLILRILRFRTVGSLLMFVILPPIFGIPVISLIYFVFRILHASECFIFVPFSMMLASLFLIYRTGVSFDLLKSMRENFRKLLFVGIVYAVFLLHFSYYAGSIYHDASGGFVIGGQAYDDSIWGVTVSAELQHSVPPELPIFSGYKLRYHYLPNLFVEMLHRTSGTKLPMLEFYYKFVSPPLLFWLMGTLLLVFTSYFNRFSMTVSAILLTTLLSSPIPFFYKHHYVLTVICFFTACFFLLRQYLLKNLSSYARAAFFLFGVMLLYDAIIGAVTLASVLLYSVVRTIKDKRFSPIFFYGLAAIVLSSGCMTILLGFPQHQDGNFIFGEGVLTTTARIRFRNLHRFLSIVFHILSSPGNPIHEFFRTSLLAFSRGAVFTYTLFFPPWAAPIGYQFLAFPAVFKALRHPDKQDAMNTIAAFCLILSFFVSSFVVFKPNGPAVVAMDRALIFSFIFLMPLTVQAIFALWESRRIFARVFLISLAVFYLVIPNVRAFPFKQGYYAYIDRATMQVFDFIRNQTNSDSIVLHPFRDNPIYRVGEPPEKPAWVFEGHYYFMSAVGERKAVFEGAVTSSSYLMGDLTYADAVDRVEEVDKFYQTDDPAWARAFLEKLNVNYVWMLKGKPLRFALEGFLAPAFQNEKNVLFAVTAE